MITAKDHVASSSIFRYLAVLVNKTVMGCYPFPPEGGDVFIRAVEFGRTHNVITFNKSKDTNQLTTMIISNSHRTVRDNGNTFTLMNEPFITPREVETHTPTNQRELNRLRDFVSGLVDYGFDVPDKTKKTEEPASEDIINTALDCREIVTNLTALCNRLVVKAGKLLQVEKVTIPNPEKTVAYLSHLPMTPGSPSSLRVMINIVFNYDKTAKLSYSRTDGFYLHYAKTTYPLVDYFEGSDIFQELLEVSERFLDYHEFYSSQPVDINRPN